LIDAILKTDRLRANVARDPESGFVDRRVGLHRDRSGEEVTECKFVTELTDVIRKAAQSVAK